MNITTIKSTKRNTFSEQNYNNNSNMNSDRLENVQNMIIKKNAVFKPPVLSVSI